MHAPSFTTYRDTGAVSKRTYLTNRPDVIFEVPKCTKIQISGAPPRTQLDWGSLLMQRAYSLHCSSDLLAGGRETRCPIPITPTPVLLLSPLIRSRFYGSQGLTHYRVVCCQL